MHDPNRTLKWALVIGLVIMSLVVLWPPERRLKGGIDLVGGTSLLYEIDTAGLDPQQQSGLSTKVMGILRERVDPQGQMNLEWRPVGSNRLEVRMPMPPRSARMRRDVWEEAREALQNLNISRFDVESALDKRGPEREAALEGLIRGVAERKELLAKVVEAFDRRQEVIGGEAAADDPAALEQVTHAYEDAIAELLATSMPMSRLLDILVLRPGTEREEQLAKLKDEFPSYDNPVKGAAEGTSGATTEGTSESSEEALERAKGSAAGLLTQAVDAYDGWTKNKSDLEDPSDLKRRLRGAGVLEFRIVAKRRSDKPDSTSVPQNPQLEQSITKYKGQLAKYGPRLQAGDRYQWFPVKDIRGFLSVKDPADLELRKNDPQFPIYEEYAGQYYVLAHSDRDYGLLRGTGDRRWALRQATPYMNPATASYEVNFTLDPRGGRMFHELTGNNVGRWLCIFLDDQAMSFANIVEAIGEHCQIRGRFTVEEIQNMVRTLEAGSLPARLKEPPLQEKTIGPTLGETNRTRGLNACLWGAGAVALFMLIYYRLVAGGVAIVALALNILFVLAAMAATQATFTLPGIAGLILTIGMAVDANVLIYERIREELERGVVLKKAINAGYDKAFSTILDANITTLITCVILGFVGSEEVKGFAVTLGIGVAMSMFTSLFVTRLAYNTFLAKGWLKKLRLVGLIGVPNINWMGLRRYFLPISGALVAVGGALFLTLSLTDREGVYDIEFLGGTSVQIDLKPGVQMSDEEVRQDITALHGVGDAVSAVQWLNWAAGQLEQAEVSSGMTAGTLALRSSELVPAQLKDLVRSSLEGRVEKDGIRVEGDLVLFEGKPGQLTLETFQKAVTVDASARVRLAADRLRGARVQSVSDIAEADSNSLSYEIATIETDRSLVQTAVVAALGDRLSVQRALHFEPVRDESLTMESYFVVEGDDTYLSDVLPDGASFDIRRFRGGVAVEAVLADEEEALPLSELERRLREVGLLPEFERLQTRESSIFPLGEVQVREDGQEGYKRFAIVAVDDKLLYEDDEYQWAESLAKPQLAQVEAALGREKSLSKVVQFSPQVAGQTKQKAIFSIILALGAIVVYIALRFGTKDFGFAAIVAVVHDICLTLGMIGLSHIAFNTGFGRMLGLEDFRVDLAMVAAILTVLGYSLNDTIVVFDRIRENRGRTGAFSDQLIDSSINQTLSRTLLTSLTTLVVVAILFFFGGAGVHGFSYALLVGIIVGTYSSIGIAAPLLYQPRLLFGVVYVMSAIGLAGVILAMTEAPTARLILIGLVAVGAVVMLVRNSRLEHVPSGRRTAGA